MKNLFKRKYSQNKDIKKKEKKLENIIAFLGFFILWGSLYYIILYTEWYDQVYQFLESKFSMDLWLVAFLIILDFWLLFIFYVILILLSIKNLIIYKNFIGNDSLAEFLKSFVLVFVGIAYFNGFILFIYFCMYIFFDVLDKLF